MTFKHDVCGQAVLARRLPARHDMAGTNPRVRAQRGGYFARLDTEAADLYLIVVTAYEFDRTIGPLTSQIASSEQPRTAVKRVLDKACLRLLRTADITCCYSQPPDVDLTDHARRYERTVRIQQQYFGSADRATNRDPGPILILADDVKGGEGRGFGRAIGVYHVFGSARLHHRVHPVRVKGFASDQKVPQ